MIAQVVASGRAQPSFACAGNRVYTGLGEGEVYFAVPGGRLEAFVHRLAAVAAANEKLVDFTGRAPALEPRQGARRRSRAIDGVTAQGSQ